MSKLNQVVDEAAVTLVGMRPEDQGAAMAAALEALVEKLVERYPDVSDEQVRGVCEQFAHRVQRRLTQLEQHSRPGALH